MAGGTELKRYVSASDPSPLVLVDKLPRKKSAPAFDNVDERAERRGFLALLTILQTRIKCEIQAVLPLYTLCNAKTFVYYEP